MSIIDDDFYHILFVDAQAGDVPSDIELALLEQANDFLYAQPSFDEHVSMLPGVLSQLISTIDDPQVDFIKVVSELCEAPDVARKILRIANSAMYNKQKKDIKTISHATALIGLASVAYIGASAMMEHVTRTKSSYFKSFSDLIHKHALLTATACRDLAHEFKVNSFCCHLLGLINIVGIVYCFNCLSSTLGKVNAVKHPQPDIYIDICRLWSSRLTVEIGKTWALPPTMLDALEHTQAQSSGLAKMLFKADRLSKITLLVEQGKMDRDNAIVQLAELGVADDYIVNFWQISAEI